VDNNWLNTVYINVLKISTIQTGKTQ